MAPRIVFRVHALRRMFERRITADDVLRAIRVGETIETYADDTPYPSRLILAWIAGRPLHVVIADNEVDQELIVITTYRPDSAAWDVEFKKRSKT